MVGSTISHYRILRKLGSGGMGEVFEAEDLKLGRNVALKFLPPHTRTREALERLRLEARAASALNHENICTVFAVEEEGDELFIAMELLEGEPLSQVMAAGPLPSEQVLAIGLQVADALDGAHRKGIIHRDIKPPNIFLTARGRVKVLDFGVAKLAQSAAASSGAPTGDVPAGLTLTGVAVGTAAYMSPEQARGEPLDARSDLFSFGCVLYQMATGRHPFTAATPALMMNAILEKQPAPPRALNPGLPVKLEEVILKTLEKDPDLRAQSAGEVRADLKRVQRELTGYISSGTVPAVPWRRKSLRARLLIGLSAALIAILLIAVINRVVGPGERPQVKLEPLTSFTDSALAPALSPDGRMVAYVRTPAGSVSASSQKYAQIYLQMLPNGEAKQLTSDSRAKNWPEFSLDGSRVGYTSTDQHFVWDTWQVPVLGGDPTPLLRNAGGLTWIPGGRLLYSKIVEGLHMGVATGGESRTEERMIYLPPGLSSMAHRSFLSPDGKWLLVVEMDHTGTWLPCRLLSFDGSSAGHPVGPPKAQCTAAGWSPDQSWMYFSSSAGGAFHLWRQRFPDGAPQQLTFGPTEEEGISVAPDGKSLVTALGTRQSTVWIHDAGGDRQLTSQGYSLLPSLTPDGKSVYYVVRGDSSRNYTSGELWRVDVGGTHAERALPGVTMLGYSLSPDGRKVAYATPDDQPQPGIWIADLDRRSAPRQLTHGAEYRAYFGAPGEIVFMSNTQPRYIMRMDEDGGNQRRVSDEPVLYLFSVSPNGGWAAFSAAVGHGEETTQLRAVPLRGGKSILICDVCVAGFGPARVNTAPVTFSQDGRWLYFSLQYAGDAVGQQNKTAALPLRSGVPFNLVTNGQIREADLVSRFGARILEPKDVFPANDPSVYVFSKSSTQTNIYRVVLP